MKICKRNWEEISERNIEERVAQNVTEMFEKDYRNIWNKIEQKRKKIERNVLKIIEIDIWKKMERIFSS